MNKLLLLLLLPAAAFAQTADKEFKIKGKLDMIRPVDWVYLNYAAGGQRIYDSVQPKDGEFKIEGMIAEPTQASFIVKYAPQPGEARAKRESMVLFLDPGKMELTAKDSLKINSVTGSTSHVEYTELSRQVETYTAKLTPLYEEYSRQNKKGDKDGMEKVETAIREVQKELEENVYAAFVRSHTSSPVGLYALKQYAGWDINPEKVEPLLNALSPKVRKLPSALALQEQLDIAKKTAIGKEAMDFTQNDTLGRPVSLSSFRGKYVLVDFWASWCGPCRRENPNVVRAFNTFKDRNFTVLGVSLDRPDAKDKWMAAIHKDGLTWTQVSDLKYWDNAVAKQYGIRAIPQNFLIDPQGKIIAKNVTGEELVKKLEEVLPK